MSRAVHVPSTQPPKPATAAATAGALLLRIGPGVFSEKPFVHDHWEEVYLAEGDLIVGNDAHGNGGVQFHAPTYACRPPGVYHGPFKSERGCLLFELHYYQRA